MLKPDQRELETNRALRPMERLPVETGEAFDMAVVAQRNFLNDNAVHYGLKSEYQTILDDLEKRTGQRFINPVTELGAFNVEEAKDHGAPTRFNAQLKAINDFIERKKTEIPDLTPINPDQVWDGMVQKGQAAGEEWTRAQKYRSGWASASGFVGNVYGAFSSPTTIGATVAGTGAAVAITASSGGLGALALAGGGINAAAEVISEPGKRVNQRTFGLPERDIGNVVQDVAIAGAAGAAMEVGGVLIGKAVNAGVKAATPAMSKVFQNISRFRGSADPTERSVGTVVERANEAAFEDNPSAYTGKVATAESGGNPAAKAKTSSATGTYQFTEGTWNDMAAETGVPPIVKGQPDPRANSEFQDAQMQAYTAKSRGALQTAGLPVDDTNLYLAHFLGQTGAVDFLRGLQSDPTVPAASLVSPEAAAANKQVFFKNGQPVTAGQLYRWASKKMGGGQSEIPETHIRNYDQAMSAMDQGAPAPEPAFIPGKMVQPYVEGLEKVDPSTVKVDAKTFQFKEGGNELGVTDRLKGVDKWQEDFAGVALVYEGRDGSRFIADGHQRLNLAQRAQAAGQADVFLNAKVLREADGWTPDAVRVRAALKNIAEGTGSPIDTAKILRAAREADLPPLPPTSALVRQGRALANLDENSFGMVVNGVVPENYGAIVGRLVNDPKLQEAALRVLHKTQPENAIQAETIVRQVMSTDVNTSTQSTLFGDEVISESLYMERARVLDASLKALKKDKQVFSTLVQQADQIEGAGNVLSRQANIERMSQDAKVADFIQKLAGTKGPVSDALTAAAQELREGARPGDATRSFLQAVRQSADDGLDFRYAGRGAGSTPDSQLHLEPAEIRTSQEAFDKQQPDFLDQQLTDQVDAALTDGRLSKDDLIYVDAGDGTLVKSKIGKVLDDLDQDKTLVDELTDCVGGGAEV